MGNLLKILNICLQTEWWEEMKIQVRCIFQKEGKRLGNRSQNIKNITIVSHELHKELCNREKGENFKTHQSLIRITDKIKDLEQEIIKGAIFRSKARWVREGEKCSKYFFALEKRNYSAKTMYQIKRSDGTIITQQKCILLEQM